MLIRLTIAAALCGIAADTASANENWPICSYGKRITCIVDGDTFWRNGTKYRIVGFDAPETGKNAQCRREQELASQATKQLQNFMRKPGLKVVDEGVDRYDRILARVENRDGDVADQMVARGLGDRYNGGYRDRGRWCR